MTDIFFPFRYVNDVLFVKMANWADRQDGFTKKVFYAFYSSLLVLFTLFVKMVSK